MSRTALFVLVSAIGCATACGPAESPVAETGGEANAVEGVWRVTELSAAGPTQYALTDPPSVFIFTKTHYMMMMATGTRPSFKAISPVPDEKVAAYDSFIANAGTYELAGSTLTIRPIIAKHPHFMGGGHDTYEVRREGDALLLSGSSANIRFSMNGQLMSDPDPPAGSQLRLVRLE